MSDDRDRAPIPGVRRALEVPPSKRRVHRSVQEELRFHIEERIEELVAAGMSRADAEAEARRRFGDVRAIGSELETIDLATHRRRSLVEMLHAVWDDARYAVRGLVRQPGFALAVILTLALGIGATTAIFSAVDAVLLRPLPTPWLDRLIVVRYDAGSLNLRNSPLSPGRTLDLLERTEVFETGAGYHAADFNLTLGGEGRRVSGALTVGDFFGAFGMRPHLGRFYRPAESDPGSPPVVVLGYGMWQELFGGEASAVGRSLRLNDRPYEIVGVAPPSGWQPRSAQLWMPQALTPQLLRRDPWVMTAVFRLREGVDWPMLEQSLASQNAEWMGGPPSSESRVIDAPVAVSFVEFSAGELRPILLVLMAAVVFVLLIACANIASLQLVRATGRAHEVAVRVALGSGRWPILRQRLVESGVLAVVGGALGLLLGAGAIEIMGRLDIGRFDALRDVRLDGSVLLFTATAVVLSGLVFGVGPAIRAARVDPHEAMKQTPRGASSGSGRQRFLQAAVVVQLALASVLLLGAGLAIRSLARLLEVDRGFAVDHVLTMQVSPSGTRYGTPALRDAFRRVLVERLGAAPGVSAAGIVFGLPFTDQVNSSPFGIRGAAPLPDGKARHANMWFTGGDYFEAMGIPLLAGRYFDERDVAGAEPVAIVDEQLATEYFPGESPMGQRIDQGGIEGAVIVGVVASVKKNSLGEPAKAAIYHPYAQNPWTSGWMSIVLRGTGAPESLVNTARTIIGEVDPVLPIYDVQAMSTRVEQSLGARRFAMRLLGGFAMLALLLASLGIYGVISYATSQRSHEIGIRLALGAKPGDITRMVLRTGAALAAAGLAGGAIIFMGAERALGSILYGLEARDPLTMTVSVLLLASIALCACWIPARRAARVNPTVALRTQ